MRDELKKSNIVEELTVDKIVMEDLLKKIHTEIEQNNIQVANRLIKILKQIIDTDKAIIIKFNDKKKVNNRLFNAR